MSVAPDGSPVELYALLPDLGEGDVVAEAVPAGASILELGCGAGRITRQLVRRGYEVTAVDESAEMLARVEGVQTVCARIEHLDLGRHFDAALLASNLINAPGGACRQFLNTCRRHSELVIVEGLRLGWQPEERDSHLGFVTSWLRIGRIEDDVVHGVVEYAGKERRWQHQFAMRVFADREELVAVLTESGLRLERWLDSEDGRWFVAVPG
jgi:SAM-dependent methyltransferase